jgi:hypothetical protein
MVLGRMGMMGEEVEPAEESTLTAEVCSAEEIAIARKNTRTYPALIPS